MQRYRIDCPEQLESPSLVIFEEIVRSNLATAISLAGRPERLRLHAKTHKMPAIVKMQESLGIYKHKCATLAEAEMIAGAGGQDILIAYPLIGPNLARLVRLIEAFPDSRFRVVVDHADAARELSRAVASLSRPLPTLIDLDVGMGRTGILPGEEAMQLYGLIADLPGLEPDGLHAYDGHQRASDPAERRESALRGIQPVLEMRDRLVRMGLPVPRLVLGGTPTFPVYAASNIPDSECSPGTSTLHDAGYGTKFPDLPFSPAALLLTRVISHPGSGRMTLDLGHKAVAADPVGARLVLLGLPGATLGGQSEEHQVVEVANSTSYPLGAHFLAIPVHVCPTVALHQKAYVIREGKLVDEWEVTARNRR
jgi:D-serine deaminase-like pyridoxal phosphate-dependent protein